MLSLMQEDISCGISKPVLMSMLLLAQNEQQLLAVLLQGSGAQAWPQAGDMSFPKSCIPGTSLPIGVDSTIWAKTWLSGACLDS